MNSFDVFNTLFDAKLIEAIRKNAKEVKLKEGELLLDVGQVVRVIPIVLSGTLKVSRIDDEGHELFLYYIHPNES